MCSYVFRSFHHHHPYRLTCSTTVRTLGLLLGASSRNSQGPHITSQKQKNPQDGNNKDSGVGFLQFFGLDSFGFFWPPLKWPNLVGIGNALVDPKCCVRWNAILRGPKPESIYFLAPKLLSLVAVRVAKLFSYFTLGLRLKKTKALCFLDPFGSKPKFCRNFRILTRKCLDGSEGSSFHHISLREIKLNWPDGMNKTLAFGFWSNLRPHVHIYFAYIYMCILYSILTYLYNNMDISLHCISVNIYIYTHQVYIYIYPLCCMFSHMYVYKWSYTRTYTISALQPLWVLQGSTYDHVCEG